jgi:HSP20 family protein
MAMLLRFDPFQTFDRLSRELFSYPGWTGSGSGWMPMDAWRRGDVVEVAFDLPGIDPGSVDLTVEQNILTVKAERRWQPEEGVAFFVRERPQGTFTRQIVLSDAVDLDKVEARYENGVLFVTAPVAETAKPHKIEIKAGNGHSRQITAGSSKQTTAA